jgi:predicted nucleic acid-binding protein
VKTLIGTNVLVVAIDPGEGKRRARASSWLDGLARSRTGVLSTQALSELANVGLRRRRPHLDPRELTSLIDALRDAFEILPVTPAIVLEALRGVRDHELSWFDAQMWAAAHLHQVPFLLSEDMDAGATYDGVTIVDPFATAPA